MNEVSEKKKIIHQGRNVRITRESRGLYQKDLGDKINKQQSEISKIESQEIIEDNLLEQIALALEVPMGFLKNFDLNEHIKPYYNSSTNTNNSAENSHDAVNQGHIERVEYNYPIEELAQFTEKFLCMQREHYEKEQQIIIDSSKKDIEIALLKQELEFLKNKK